MAPLGMALTLVRGLGQLSALAPCLAPISLFYDPLEIATALPGIMTALPEIMTALPDIMTALPEIVTALAV